MKQLITIEEHNDRVLKPRTRYTGIECPRCKTELQYSEIGVMYMTNPPQVAVDCPKCGFDTKVHL